MAKQMRCPLCRVPLQWTLDHEGEKEFVILYCSQPTCHVFGPMTATAEEKTADWLSLVNKEKH